MMPLTLALVLCCQETAPQPDVKALVARIDGKDPEACFDAVARLADLPASARAEIDAAVAAMPDELAFYKSALAEELKTRDRLGDKYTREARVTIDAKDKQPSEILRDIMEQSKDRVESTWAFQGGGGQQPVTMKLDNVPYLAALRTLCKEAKLRIYSYGGALTLYRGGGDGGPTFQYRNHLVTIDSVQRNRRVTFGAGEKRSLILSGQVLCDMRANVVDLSKVEAIEAVDDKGRKLDVLPDDKPDTLADESAENAANANPHLGLTMTLAPPEKGVEKIARVRAQVVLHVPRTTSRYVVPADKPEKASDEHFEVSVESTTTVHRQIHTIVRVRPKGDLKAFLEMPVQIRMKTKDGTERPCYANGKVAGGAVEYTAQRYQTAEEQMQGRVPELESVVIMVHRETVERRIAIEFRDIPVE